MLLLENPRGFERVTFYACISALSRGYTACKGRSPLGRGRGGAGKGRGGERRPDGARQGAPRCRASAGRGWHSGTPRVLPPGRLLRGGGDTGAPQGRAKLSYGDALTLLNVYVFLRIGDSQTFSKRMFCS